MKIVTFLKRALIWNASAMIFGAAAWYVIFIYPLLDKDPNFLLASMDVERPWLAWTCKQVLRHVTLTPETVNDLNQRGGALFPVLLKDDEEAEDMLKLFLARGVDINAGDIDVKNVTALHAIASDGNVDRARMLLRHGARIDARDQDGRTPLDWARRMQSRYPDIPKYASMVRFLEEQEAAPGR